MKSLTYLFVLLLLAICSCGPENEKVTDEQVETGSPTEVLDSVANPSEDGVNTDGEEPSDSL